MILYVNIFGSCYDQSMKNVSKSTAMFVFANLIHMVVGQLIMIKKGLKHMFLFLNTANLKLSACFFYVALLNRFLLFQTFIAVIVSRCKIYKNYFT